MDSELKSLLEKNIKVSEENNKLLVRLHNIQRWNLISRIIYWLVLIGIALGAFYFIKPFISSFLGIYNMGGSSSFNPLDTMNSLNELLK